MTTMNSSFHKCCRCGKISEFTEIMSTNMMGAIDLDTRPPEMKRSTMCYWVQECPECGYVSEDISKGTDAPDELFTSEEYVSYGGIPFVSDLARIFYRLYLVRRAEGKVKEACWAALYAAWASDDRRDAAVAAACRKLALEQLEILLEHSRSATFELLRLDLLRRIGEFDAVVEYAAKFRSDDPFLMRVAALQSRLAANQDDACHDCSEAKRDVG